MGQIGKGTFGISPTSNRRGPKFLVAGNARTGPMIPLKAHTIFSNIISGPTSCPTQQIRVKTHERLTPDNDGHPLVRHVVLRKLRANGRLGVGKIRL